MADQVDGKRSTR